MRKVTPFAAAIVLAFVVVAFVRATHAVESVAALMTGFAAGVLLISGAFYAFALGGNPRQTAAAKTPLRKSAFLHSAHTILTSAGLSLLTEPTDSKRGLAT